MSYKDVQQHYRNLSEPRVVPEEEWDEHDKLFMEKGTPINRKAFRRKFPHRKYTKRQLARDEERNMSKQSKRIARQKHRKSAREARA